MSNHNLEEYRAARQRDRRADDDFASIKQRVLAEYEKQQPHAFLAVTAVPKGVPKGAVGTLEHDGFLAAQAWDLQPPDALKVFVGTHVEGAHRATVARLLRAIADRIERATDGPIGRHFSESPLSARDSFVLGPAYGAGYQIP